MNSGFSKYAQKKSAQSIYCYPNTDILINKANIMDASALALYEADVTAMRQYILENMPLKGRFGITHLKNIHHFIFQDVYPFAGKLRLEDIWKGDTFFCKTQFIQENLVSLLGKLNEESRCQRTLKPAPGLQFSVYEIPFVPHSPIVGGSVFGILPRRRR